MSCETSCFELQVQCCDDILIKAGLTPTDTLQAIIQKPAGANVYKREVVVDADGNITIEKVSLPPGFLATGFLNVQLKKGEDFTEEQLFTFNSKTYKCLQLELVDNDIIE